jgi:hypothetical protein
MVLPSERRGTGAARRDDGGATVEPVSLQADGKGTGKSRRTRRSGPSAHSALEFGGLAGG